MRIVFFLAFLGVALMCYFSWPIASEVSRDEARETYDELLNATDSGKALLYNDNLEGRIVWNEAPFMESLIDMYEATSDHKYLDIFQTHADHVLSMRDDNAMRPDYAGRRRPGWQAGAYYTLGIPIMIPDAAGKPALWIRAIHRVGNNATVVRIAAENDTMYSIVVCNGFRQKIPSEERFDALAPGTTEARIDAGLSPDSWIQVHVVGSGLPLPGEYALNDTCRSIIHELHTPVIGIPFLRFANLVFHDANLSMYRSDAERYVRAFEESASDYDPVIFAADEQFWAQGLAVPHNGLSASGRLFLLLYKCTGNTTYLEQATALAQKVRSGMTFHQDGTISMPYWPPGSMPYEGGSSDLYSQIPANRGTEDVSHFSQTLLFMIEAEAAGIVFSAEDLAASERTFDLKLWKHGHIAHGIDGSGQAYDYAASGFAVLSPDLRSKVSQIYGSEYRSLEGIEIDDLYGQIMLGWSRLATR